MGNAASGSGIYYPAATDSNPPQGFSLGAVSALFKQVID